MPKEVKRSPAELTLRDALYLLALFRHSVSEDLSLAEPYAECRVRLAPSFEDTQRVAKHLWSKGLILVSPDSNTDAFIFNDDITDCPRLYLAKVMWEFLPGQLTHSADYQFIDNSGYNSDRGPVPVQLKVHGRRRQDSQPRSSS